MRLPSSRLCREVISLSSRHLPLRCPASAVAARPTSLLLTRSLFATSKRSTRFFSTQLAEAASPFPSTASGPVGPISFSPPPSSSPSSSAPSPSPSSSSRQLPYDVHSAKAVAETIPSPISAADEGEACPMILQQVEEDYTLPHPLWKADEVNAVSVTHRVTESVLDTLAYWTIKTIRFNFDIVSGWVFGVPTKEKALSRIIFLESVAGVPGSVASTLRHLASLRRLKRDYGWIHTLLEEAENERMHLLTFLELKQPGKFMRFSVFMSQGIFFNFFFMAYLLSPRYCHRLVGYLEEEAVKTYTELIKLVDGHFIEEWNTERPPPIAIKYWKMKPDSTIRDLLLMVRADESHHRDVNHCLADLKPEQLNPYGPGK